MTKFSPETENVPVATRDEVEAWRQAVDAELKGASFEKKLVTKTFEGIALQPVYFSEHASRVTHLGAGPGEGALARGAKVLTSGGRVWEFLQEFSESDAGVFNSALRTGLAGGLTSVCVRLVSEDGRERDAGYLRHALRDVVLSAVPIHVEAGSCVRSAAEDYFALASEAGVHGYDLTGSVTADPLAAAVILGTSRMDRDSALDQLATWTSKAAKEAPQLATISVSGTHWLEAGGDATQELAFTLAAGVLYLRSLEERDETAAVIAPRLRFQFAIGGRFFTEISKFRAFRLLWARVLQAFGLDATAAWPCLHARTAKWNKSRLDPHVNLLRVTTEALSAVLGGIDSLSIDPYDLYSGGPSDLSLRVARNLHTVLAEEFRLMSPADPVGGSWYVETLTDELARKAWALFQEIENRGGFVAALEEGILAKAISHSASEKFDAVCKRRIGLIGVNLFPNSKDTLSPLSEASSSVSPGPFSPKRAAEGFEQLRSASQAFASRKGKPPWVFLAKMGPVKRHKPRADFAVGFFAVGGFEIIAKQSFESAEDAARAAADSGAHVAVLCSTDETYPELAPAFAKAVKTMNPALVVVLAGYPTELVETLEASGFNEFIHVRSDVLRTLKDIFNRIDAVSSNP